MVPLGGGGGGGGGGGTPPSKRARTAGGGAALLSTPAASGTAGSGGFPQAVSWAGLEGERGSGGGSFKFAGEDAEKVFPNVCVCITIDIIAP